MQQIQTILPMRPSPRRSRSFVDLWAPRPPRQKSGSPSTDGNPRRHSARRVSKTFRRFPPEIVVHPPENLTASLPDISGSPPEDRFALRGSSVSENNLSCPDLADERIYRQFPEPLGEQCGSRAESVAGSSLRELRELQRKLAPKRARGRERRRAAVGNPSEILRVKLKTSLSMHNLLARAPRSEGFYDCYHTVHSGADLLGDYPGFGCSRCEDGGRGGSDGDREVIYKCCCGRTRCKAVVPIQQYLETYFDKRVSDTDTRMVSGLLYGP